MLEFDWDSAKAAANIRKHGVSFEEARSVFYDDFAIQFYDAESTEPGEDRFLLLGLSSESRVLTRILHEGGQELVDIQNCFNHLY